MKYKLPVIIAAVFVIAFLVVEYVHGLTMAVIPTQTNTYRNYEFFATSTTPFSFTAYTATTTSATSTNMTAFTNSNTGEIDNGYMVVAGAKQITLYFSRGDTSGQGNAGSSKFRIQVTPDGTNWFDYNTLYQNLATSTNPTIVSTVTISAATSSVITSMDIRNQSFYAIRCIVLETTDGEHSCKATAQF